VLTLDTLARLVTDRFGGTAELEGHYAQCGAGGHLVGSGEHRREGAIAHDSNWGCERELDSGGKAHFASRSRRRQTGATYLYAVQRTNCGAGNPACVASPSTAGLSFYRSMDEGQT
jgi:hypothetical protein